MVRKREILIEQQDSGKILLDWLSRRYTYHNHEKWSQYIQEGRVKINGKVTTINYLLVKGDKVEYFPEPVIEPPINPNYTVLYEDDDLLVLNKPSDLPCHPGGIYFEHTLWYLLKQRYDYISLVNRLDRETSGVMLVAKNKISAKYFFNLMMNREIEKEYMVLVYGSVEDDIDAKGWLIKDSNSSIRKKRAFLLDENAKQLPGENTGDREFAHSYFKPISRSNNFTLLHCTIYTGRTHQIRATISSLGYPVVGDKIYGSDDSYFFKFINDELTQEEWDSLYLKNQALHSFKTTLTMMDGSLLSFTAPLPEHWPLSTI